MFVITKGQFMLWLPLYYLTTQTPLSKRLYFIDLTCRKVLAPGARVLSMMERMEKMMIWMVAPPAYQ